MSKNTTIEKKAKKDGLFTKAKRSFSDMKGETKKIVWPTKKQIINNTGVVITFMIIAAIFVGVLDTALSTLISLFLRNV